MFHHKASGQHNIS